MTVYLQPFISRHIKKFWDELNNQKLVAPKCIKCDHKFFPPRAHCPKCLSKEFEWLLLSGEGTLYSWTFIRLLVEDPYILGIIELKEGIGRSIATVNAEEKDLKIGLKMIANYQEKNGQKYLNWIPK